MQIVYLFVLKNVAISNYSLEKVYEGYKTLEFNVGYEEKILTIIMGLTLELLKKCRLI